MARRRKVPVRKHHGIRDPLKQLEAKEKKLKNVTNCPPQKDDQKMSFKFMQFKKLADHAKTNQKVKRIRSGVEDKPKDFLVNACKNQNFQADGSKFKKSIKQMPNEEDKDYMRRVNRITSESLKEAQYEAKYGVKVMRDPNTGEIKIKKKTPNEIDELLKQKKAGKVYKKKLGVDNNAKPIDRKLAKELIKQVIQDEKLEKMKQKELETIEYRKDNIKFGEIVHAPPTISALPRKAVKGETVPRPGKKNNLLLKDLLKHEKDVVSDTAKNTPITNNKNKSDHILGKSILKGKRKNIPEATRNMLEMERQKFVNLYRDLKKSKGIQADKS